MTESRSDRSGSSARETSAFDRLAPFIQEFIWKRGWTEMRDIQVRAARAAFETEKHLLLAAGTASGKTEAAFLPILTQLSESPPSTVGALYIGPLKALINDQFLRLNDLCAEAEIQVTPWHGDIGASKKGALLKRPTGILQITPEALEGLLLRRPGDLARLFGDLRWIVVDEIHAFMASDRGGQVLSLLDRLSRYAFDKHHLPRRVGLSATLGDYGEAADWLSGGQRDDVEVVAESGGRAVFLLVDHYPVKSRHDVDDGTDADQIIESQSELLRAAYDATRSKKSLIFTNTRADAEEIITGLRRIAERSHDQDIFHVHHGSIAAALREAAETAMREGASPACTAATLTLELGIDLGQLDRVLQLGPTATVASFLQRLGRAGRRGQKPEMFFLLREEEAQPEDTILDQIPWELLQTIAIVQLYAEERWIEPIARATLPGSLLYQQTMSTVGAAGELAPPQLAERVLTLAPFQHVSQEDFRRLLHHLLGIDHLEQTDEGGLMLGLVGGTIVHDFHFLATFADSTEWAVKEGSNDIGTIGGSVPVGERFALAGRTWEAIDVAPEQKTIIVRRIRGSVGSSFAGVGGADIHDKVVERMRRVLADDATYPYLTERASVRLEAARRTARVIGVGTRPMLLSLGGNKAAILPWCGSKQLRTMQLLLEASGFRSTSAQRFHIEFDSSPDQRDAVASRVAKMALAPMDGGALVSRLERHSCERAKYDEFLPEPLLKKGFAADRLDITGALESLVRSLA